MRPVWQAGTVFDPGGLTCFLSIPWLSPTWPAQLGFAQPCFQKSSEHTTGARGQAANTLSSRSVPFRAVLRRAVPFRSPGTTRSRQQTWRRSHTPPWTR
jgi:hypothetical protein